MNYASIVNVMKHVYAGKSIQEASLTQVVSKASRLIDLYTGRWFYADTQTRKYDAIGMHITGRLLLLDADLLSIEEITVADSTSAGGRGWSPHLDQIILRPVNWPPYFGVALKASSGLHWNTLPHGIISIRGSWGYSSTPPEDIEMATVELAGFLTMVSNLGDIKFGEFTERQWKEFLPTYTYDTIGCYKRLRASVIK